MNSTIYLRGLRHVDFSVFAVEADQKKYYDTQFERYVPYSSGQQVKRSIIERTVFEASEKLSPTTFVFKKEKLKEEEVYGTCNPRDIDQLIGGWMKVPKGGNERSIKRRSPLSISAMRPIHPLLAGIAKENLSFDRTNTSNINKIIVRDNSGNILTDEEVAKMLEGSARSLNRKWIQDNGRATGLFVYDVAIDLRRLFCVSNDLFEPEVAPTQVEELKAEGWIETENIFGPCLLAPEELRKKVIPALASSLINWRITSNQSRTFSLMETLVFVISENANKLPTAIRAKLIAESEKPKAKLIVENIDGADVFITLPAAGYFVTENESVDALEEAENKLKQMMNDYDYKNQLS